MLSVPTILDPVENNIPFSETPEEPGSCRHVRKRKCISTFLGPAARNIYVQEDVESAQEQAVQVFSEAFVVTIT